MCPEQKALIKESWLKVAPMADAAARLFYDRLFEIDATTRPLFKTTDLVEQRRKLIQALTMVVQGLESGWTPEVKVAWSGAYAVLADVMRTAAGELASRPAHSAHPELI